MSAGAGWGSAGQERKRAVQKVWGQGSRKDFNFFVKSFASQGKLPATVEVANQNSPEHWHVWLSGG